MGSLKTKSLEIGYLLIESDYIPVTVRGDIVYCPEHVRIIGQPNQEKDVEWRMETPGWKILKVAFDPSEPDFHSGVQTARGGLKMKNKFKKEHFKKDKEYTITVEEINTNKQLVLDPMIRNEPPP